MDNFLLDAGKSSSYGRHTKHSDTRFRYNEFNTGVHLKRRNTTQNFLLLFLEGTCLVSCNQFRKRRFNEKEMVLIPRNAYVEGRVLNKLKVVSFGFGIPHCNNDRYSLESLSTGLSNIAYDFEALPIRRPISLFCDLLISNLKLGVDCDHFHEIMHKELFLYLQWYYSRTELAYLLHPILANDLDFKNFILTHLPKVNKIKELIQLSSYSRSSFYRKFNSVFGMPIKQWIVLQQTNLVLTRMADPYVSIKDIMSEIDMDSPSQFNRFCRKHFGCTPLTLLKSVRSGKYK